MTNRSGTTLKQGFFYRINKKSRNAKSLRRRRPQIEQLEKRLVLAAVLWNSDTGGDWNVAANWRDEFGVNRVPGPADDVTIDRGAANPIVTISGPDQAVRSLVAREPLVLAAGRLAVSQPSSISANFQFQSGTLDADGALDLASTTFWTGGTMTGDALIRNLGTITVSAGTPTVQSATLSNAGTISQSGGTLNLVTAQLQNAPTGLYQLASDGGITSTSSTFSNAGALRKTAGVGTSTIASAINNTGTVEVQSGTVSLTGAITQHVGSVLTGGTWTIGTGATLNFATGANITTNQSNVTLSGTGSTFTKINSLATNSGTFSLQAGRDFTAAGNVLNSGTLVVGDGSDFSPGPFHFTTNTGTIRKSSAPGSSTVLRLNNTGGTVEVQSGILTLQDGSGNGGVWNVSSGAVLNPNGTSASSTYSGTFSGAGAGVVRLSAGTLFFGTGGLTLDLDGGGFEWTGGNLRSDNGVNGLINQGLFTISGAANRQLGGPITNTGTINSNGTGTILFLAATIDNQAGGVLDLQSDGTIFVFGNAPSLIQNSGIVRKSAGSGESRITTQFNNTGGTIDVQSGNLVLAIISGSNVSTGGTFQVAAGSILDLVGGKGHTLTGLYTSSGAGIVQHSSGTMTIGAAGATFDFAPGNFEWQSGTINGSGTLTNQGSLTIAGAGARSLSGTLNNLGAIRHSGAGSLTFNAFVLNNQAGAVYDLQSDADLLGGNGPFDFNNRGTFKKSGGTGTSLVSVSFNNIGATIDVDTGTVVLDNAGSPSIRSNSTGGTFSVETGATLDLLGDSNAVYTGTYTGTGGGTVLIGAGTLDVASAGATFNFPGNMLQWTGGKVRGSFFFTSLQNLGTITINGAPDKFLELVTLVNRGTVVHTGTGSLRETTGTVINEAGALYDLQSDADVRNSSSGQGFFNTGILRKSSGAGTSLVDVAFFNDPTGRIEVLTGTLTIDNLGVSDPPSVWTGAQIQVDAGATLDLIGDGTAEFTGEYTGTGAGTVIVGASTLFIGAGGATFNFPGQMLQWTGGAINVTNGTLTNLGTINIAGANTKTLAETNNDPDISLINRGIIIHSGTGNLQTQFTAINNEGTGVYELLGDADILTATFSETINNSGAFRKSSGAGNSVVSVRMNNTGVVDVRSGTLTASAVNQTAAGTLTGGTWNVVNATLAMPNAGNLTINQGNVTLDGTNSVFANIANIASNSGSFALLGNRDFTTVGNLTNTGIVTIGSESELRVSGNYTQASTLAIEIAGSPASGRFGRLTATGTASLDGVFRAHFNPVAGYTPQVGDAFQVMTFGSRLGTFDHFEGLDFGGITFFQPILSATDLKLGIVADAADLMVEDIAVPATAVSGQDVTITYTVRNHGTPTTIDRWIDSVYLSADSVLDPADKLIGRVQHLGAVAGLAHYSESLTAPLPGVIEGNYRVIVVADTRALAPDLNRTNNTRVSADTVAVDVPVLTLGGTESGTIANNQDVYFRLDVQPGRDVLLTANFTAATQAEFTVGFEQVPDRSQFDQSAAVSVALEHQLTVGIPSGRYYILLHGREGAAGGKPFTFKAEEEPFVLQDVGLVRGANAGTATLPLNGSGFIPDTQASLVAADGVIHAAQNVLFDSSLQVFATFDLTGLPIGVYDVQLTQHGENQTLADAFQVATGTPGQLRADVVVPETVRIGRSFSGLVEYRNTGDTDLVAPILILSTRGQAPLRLRSSDPFANGDLILVAASPDGPAGILRPGQEGRIAFSAVITNADRADFELSFKRADATDLIDYNAVEQEVRPEGVEDADWNPVFQKFRTDAGPTWGGFVRLMSAFATRVAQQGGTAFSARDVFAAVLQENFDQLNSSVSGRVFRDDTDHPLAGVLVSLANSDGSEAGLDVTGPDGTFRILTLPAGTYSLTVSEHVLLVPVQVVVPPSGTVSDLSVVASPGGTIRGNVRSAGDKTALSNVPIVASRETQLFTTQTDTEGTFILRGLPPGTYELAVGGEPFETKRLVLQIASGDTLTRTDFSLVLGASLLGQVIADGSPLAAATVVLRDELGSILVTETDALGGYAFRGLSAGTLELTISKDEFAASQMVLTLQAAVATVTPPVSLVRGATAQLTVRDGAGVPIENARIQLVQTGQAVTQSATDSAGQVVFTELPSGNFDVRIAALGFRSLGDTVNLAAGSTLSREFVLLEAGVIQGVVRDAGGAPIVAIPVNIFGEDTLGNEDSTLVTTGADGSYRISTIPLGTYALTVGNNVGIHRQDVTIDAVNLQHTVNFILAGSTVTGAVVQADAVTPVERAQVNLFQNGEILATATTDGSGTYRFRAVTGGTFEVVAASPLGISPLHTVIVADNSVVESDPLVLGSVPFTGVVLDGTASPLAGAQIVLQPAASPLFARFLVATSAADGSFALGGLAPGQYTVLVHADEFADVSQRVTVSGATNLPFTLTSGFTATGVISAASSGALVAGATVQFLDQATGDVVAGVQSDSDGAYAVPNLLAGTYDVLVKRSGFANSVLAGVSVNGAVTRNAQLQGRSTSWSGSVVDDTGHAVAGATVQFINDQGTTVHLVTSAFDGSWATDLLAPGVYTATVNLIGYYSAQISSVFLQPGLPISSTATLDTAGTDEPFFVNDVLTEFAVFVSRGVASGLELDPSLAVFDPVPKKDPRDQFPTLPPAPDDCKEAFDARLRLFFDEKAKDGAFQGWEEAHKSFQTTVGASVVNITLLGADLAATSAGLVLAATFQANLAAVSNAELISLGILNSIDLVIGAAGLIDSFSEAVQANPPQTLGDAVEAVQKLFSDMAGTLADIGSVADFLKNVGKMKEGLPEFLGFLDLLSKALNLVKELSDAGKALESQLNSVLNAEAAYRAAFDKFIAARRAYSEALDDCAKRKQITPTGSPRPDNPEPGDTATTTGIRATDPNDIVGPAGFGAAGFIAPDLVLPYTIHFENLAAATAAAQTVTISQRLDSDLDPGTFELGDFGFGNLVVDVPDGRSFFSTRLDVLGSLGLFVDSTAGIDFTTGEVTWSFTSIDPTTFDLTADPLAGFLPPNLIPPVGEGFVSYVVRPKANVATGTEIRAVASIVFDTNDPITTNQIDPLNPAAGTDPNKEALVTIDASVPESAVRGLPATAFAGDLDVNWSGTDLGAGVAFFDIFVSVDGGTYSLWKTGTTDVEGLFPVEAGHTYAFYSVATDNVGHTEAAPLVPDAVVNVIEDNVPPTLVIAGANSTDEGAIYTLNLAASGPGSSTIASWTINWGDGSIQTVNGNPSSVTHVYSDGPNGFTIAASAANDAGSHPAGNTIAVTVDNVPPSNLSITLSATATNVGGSVSLGGSFLDSGLLDTHRVVVNWGDGATSEIQLAANVLNFSGLAHTYLVAGFLQGSVAVFDKDTAASETRLFQINVGRSIYVLNPSQCSALQMSGFASIAISGPVIVNSNCSNRAIQMSGNARISATRVDVVGGVQRTGNSSITPAPKTGAAPSADPFALLAPPVPGANRGAVNLSGNQQLTIEPGVYTKISASGNARVTMQPGIYVIQGGGISVTGNALIRGTGIMIYNAGGNFPQPGGSFGNFSLSGSGSFEFTPMTSGEYQGITLFQSRDNTREISLGGNSSGMSGTIYAPAALLTQIGNSSLAMTIVVDQYKLSGNSTSALRAAEGTSDAHSKARNYELVDLVYASESAGEVDVAVDAAALLDRRNETLALESFAAQSALSRSERQSSWFGYTRESTPFPKFIKFEDEMTRRSELSEVFSFPIHSRRVDRSSNLDSMFNAPTELTAPLRSSIDLPAKKRHSRDDLYDRALLSLVDEGPI